MKRLGTILSQDIAWGQLAGVAVVTAFVFVLLYNQVVGFMALLVFVIGGIYVARSRPRRPYWNAFAYGLLCILFVVGLLLLYLLGKQGQLVIGPEVGGMMLFLSLSILPQTMVGALIGVSFQRIRGTGEALGEKAKGRHAAENSSSRKAAPTSHSEQKRQKE
ncbi:MAG: hypothetical protein ACP5SI_12870 [Chloroflexia bacterium]